MRIYKKEWYSIVIIGIFVFSIMGVLTTYNFMKPKPQTNILEDQLRSSIDAKQKLIDQYKSTIDSLNNELKDKKIEYIYITKSADKINKKYNEEINIINNANHKEQLIIFTTNLKSIDSLERTGYFNLP